MAALNEADQRYLGGPRVRRVRASISQPRDRSTEPANGLGPFGLAALPFPGPLGRFRAITVPSGDAKFQDA
jgi:hypothetical protein